MPRPVSQTVLGWGALLGGAQGGLRAEEGLRPWGQGVLGRLLSFQTRVYTGSA